MANETAVQKHNESNAEYINKAAKNIAMRLPKNIDATRFMLGIMTAIQKNATLKTVDQNSLLLAAYDAAECGCSLSPALQQGWLIPYGREVQFQPSYRFFMQKAFETGDVKSFFAEVVYSTDEFTRQFAPKRHMFHAPSKGERTETNAIGAYAYVEFNDGSVDFEFLTKEQIIRHKNKSKQPNSMKWKDFWEEGWRITPIRVLAKRLPLKSRKLEEFVELANLSEERELDPNATSAEPSMPQQRQAGPTPIDAKEKAKPVEDIPESELGEVIDAEVVDEPKNDAPQNKTEEKPAQTQEMFASEQADPANDPLVNPAQIASFWDMSTKAGWKKSDVDKQLSEKFKVSKLKDLRVSQFEKLKGIIANGE
jgi:recombination protein RecT